MGQVSGTHTRGSQLPHSRISLPLEPQLQHLENGANNLPLYVSNAGGLHRLRPTTARISSRLHCFILVPSQFPSSQPSAWWTAHTEGIFVG